MKNSSPTQLLQFPQIIVLMILFSFLSVAAVVFTPAYPQLAREFHLPASSAQWVMTIFLLGTAIGRLPYGPMANKFGRKKTLFIGLYISLIGTLMILFSESYSFLCIGRFVQALGCAVTLKIGYTMVGDLHTGASATKALAYSMLAYSILPGIGTAVSGYLTPSLGWRGGFWFFLLFSILVIFSCYCLPETMKEKDRTPLRIKTIARGYLDQLSNLYLVLWGSLMGLSTAVLYIFAQKAPFIAIDLFNNSPQEYGVFFLVPAFGIAGGSLLTVWLADKMSSMNGMLLGILVLIAGSFLMGLFFLIGWASAWALFVPQAVIQLGDALLYNNASSKALSEASDKSNASSMMLFINSCLAVLGTFLVGILAPNALLTLPAVFLFITAVMLIIWFVLYYHCKAVD